MTAVFLVRLDEGYAEAMRECRRAILVETLHLHDGNRSHAAKALGLQRTYLCRLIRELDIRIPAPSRGRVAAR